MCLVTNIYNSTCGTAAAAISGQVYSESGSALNPGIDSIAGLVPDGVSSVEIALRDGSRQAATVHDNVYVAAVHGAIDQVSFSTPDGHVTVGNVGP